MFNQAFSKGGIDIYREDTGEVVRHLPSTDADLARQTIEELTKDEREYRAALNEEISDSYNEEQHDREQLRDQMREEQQNRYYEQD
jgi:hypothetical protein